MSDHDFELRIQRVLRADAERAVRQFDPVELAMNAAGASVARRPLDWRPAAWPAIRVVLIGALLLLAALATLWIVTAGAPRQPSLVVVAPSTSASAPSGLDLAELVGPWIADRPAGLTLAAGSTATRMIFSVDAGGAAVYVTPSDDDSQLLASFTAPSEPGSVRFTSRAPTISVTRDGAELRGCETSEGGTYGVSRSPDGLRLTLSVIDDPCPARAAVYARTWTRYLGRSNGGGPGVVDAFDPLFTVEIPRGSYETDRTADHLTVVQNVPEVQFLAWKDPQGWNDPCDTSKGRDRIAPGANAFVDYFRQLQGFTVDSTSELQVDGHRAVRLVVHANPDAPCPKPVEFQTKAETSDRTWFLSPGVTDSLVLVELDDRTTVMFEVLPAPNQLEDQVIRSIRFLDALPASP